MCFNFNILFLFLLEILKYKIRERKSSIAAVDTVSPAQPESADGDGGTSRDQRRLSHEGLNGRTSRLVGDWSSNRPALRVASSRRAERSTDPLTVVFSFFPLHIHLAFSKILPGSTVPAENLVAREKTSRFDREQRWCCTQDPRRSRSRANPDPNRISRGSTENAPSESAERVRREKKEKQEREREREGYSEGGS